MMAYVLFTIPIFAKILFFKRPTIWVKEQAHGDAGISFGEPMYAAGLHLWQKIGMVILWSAASTREVYQGP